MASCAPGASWSGTKLKCRKASVEGLTQVSFQNYVDTRAQHAALGLPEDEPPPGFEPGEPDRVPFWSQAA